MRTMKNIFLAVIFLNLLSNSALTLRAQEPTTLDVNDVSILLPLPKTVAEKKNHIYLLSNDPMNQVFPKGLEEKVPGLFSTPPGDPSSIYSSMLVTAMRYDPCFPALDSQNCQPQLRLTAQFYDINSIGDPVYDEVALHLFYPLSSEESKGLLKDLISLKKSSPVLTKGKELYVHPALENSTMASPWAKELKKIIFKYANSGKLKRITGMGFVFDTWPFFAVKVVNNGATVENEILKHTVENGLERQQWDIFAVNKYDLGNLSPVSSVEAGPSFFSLGSNYMQGNTPLTTQKVQLSIDSIERTLNPKVHNAETVDCASCHISRFVKNNAIKNGVAWKSEMSYQPSPQFNIKNRTAETLKLSAANIVQFGHFLRSPGTNQGLPLNSLPLPSVSDRVIYESIEVVKYLNEKVIPQLNL